MNIAIIALLAFLCGIFLGILAATFSFLQALEEQGILEFKRK